MAKNWVGARRTSMKPVPRPIAAALPAEVVADVRAAAVDAPVVVDVLGVGVVGVTIIRAMRVSLESRAGREQHSVVHCRVLRTPICQKNVPWRCLCLVEAVPASPSVRKSAHGRKSKRKRLSARSSESWRNRQPDPILLNSRKKISQPRPPKWHYRIHTWKSSRTIFDSMTWEARL